MHHSGIEPNTFEAAVVKMVSKLESSQSIENWTKISGIKVVQKVFKILAVDAT
jgi:hypothetical protein